MLLRLWLETEKSVGLDKKSGQNSIPKAFLGLQGWKGGRRGGQHSFFFSGSSVVKFMSDRHANSLQKKLVPKLIQEAALSGLLSGIKNILSNKAFAALANDFNKMLSKDQPVHK